jgi:hypothetical protein
MTKKIGCIGHDCSACATREKHINKLKQHIERWKAARIAELENALEVLRNHVQDEYDRIYISAVLAK